MIIILNGGPADGCSLQYPDDWKPRPFIIIPMLPDLDEPMVPDLDAEGNQIGWRRPSIHAKYKLNEEGAYVFHEITKW